MLWQDEAGGGPDAPAGPPREPADVARAIVFLASDAAAWMTGVVLPVDGGVTEASSSGIPEHRVSTCTPPPIPTWPSAISTATSTTTPLFAHARRLRDEGKGRVVTYSRKVFIPLTTLCRDRCTYCTFAKPPGAGGMYLEPDEVLAIARAGAEAGCTEALFTLGDRPEDRWPQAVAFLEAHGVASTLGYVAEMSALVARRPACSPMPTRA